jgi:hypothetical protein
MEGTLKISVNKYTISAGESTQTDGVRYYPYMQNKKQRGCQQQGQKERK